MLFCGAAPLSAELSDSVVRLLPQAFIGQGYGSYSDTKFSRFLGLRSSPGMTETSTTVTIVPLSQRVGTLGSAGQLISGIRARVVKPDGTPAGVGEPGELMVTGPSMALRYLDNEKA